jgi:hypothetical protein
MFLRGPITIYRNSPFGDPFAEWHEVWCERLPSGEAKVGNRHGWWDDGEKKPHYNVTVYSELFKDETLAVAEYDKRLTELASQGFIHKLQSVFDPTASTWRIERIP